ncbi:MAG: hypothetical protein HY906_09500 [Deltaproteobacteria bacterium]|nr:hypothetical protein [Deltaproteobacteria bacterium]
MLARLEREQQRYIASQACDGFVLEWKGPYLYVGHTTRRLGRRVEPLCRLRYTGDLRRWRFEIYKYSDLDYDRDQDFPFGSGTVEKCFAVAADFYLWEYDVLEAGESCGTTVEPPAPGFVGREALLPTCDLTAVPRPEFPPAARDVARGPLLADLDAFLDFVADRTVDLAPRTLGLCRADLRTVNALMTCPHELTQRPVQDRAPRVQCCFTVAEALGLLAVDRAARRARLGEGVAAFRALAEVEQWWLLLEALWNRVSWFGLRGGAYGNMERQQAGRFWLGEELARRAVPLRFDWTLTLGAEVLEVFLLPAWRDAGLVELTHQRPPKPDPTLAARATYLKEVRVTDLGRWAFAVLAATAPQYRDHKGLVTRDKHDGRWQGQDFVTQLEYSAPLL